MKAVTAGNKIKIRVCTPYPNQGQIHPKTRKSLDALSAAPDLNVECVKLEGANIAMSRNNGAKSGNKSHPDAIMHTGFDFDYYLAVDADVAFTVDDVRALLWRDVDIVSGAYLRRGSTDQIVAGQFDAQGILYNNSFMPAAAAGIQKVGWVGAGFLLIKRLVFETMPYPWFIEGVTPYEADGVKYHLHCGEDITFCRKAAEAGFDVYCDFDCRIEHLTEPPEDALTVWARQAQEKLTQDYRDMEILQQRQAGALQLVQQLLNREAGEVSPEQTQTGVQGGGGVSPEQELALLQALAEAVTPANASSAA